MDRQTENDITFVLTTLQNVASPDRLDAYLDDCGNTPEELDEAMKRLGEKVGIDAGIL